MATHVRRGSVFEVCAPASRSTSGSSSLRHVHAGAPVRCARAKLQICVHRGEETANRYSPWLVIVYSPGLNFRVRGECPDLADFCQPTPEVSGRPHSVASADSPRWRRQISKIREVCSIYHAFPPAEEVLLTGGGVFALIGRHTALTIAHGTPARSHQTLHDVMVRRAFTGKYYEYAV